MEDLQQETQEQAADEVVDKPQTQPIEDVSEITPSDELPKTEKVDWKAQTRKWEERAKSNKANAC